MANRKPLSLQAKKLLESKILHRGILHRKCVWNKSARHAGHSRGDVHLMQVWAFTYYTFKIPPGEIGQRVYSLAKSKAGYG
jgi:hypothetical protein